MTIRVLLADPDQMLLDAYRSYLSRIGFEVETAASGPDCLAKLRDWNPDVLVLEPDMGNGWGEMILDEVRLHPERRCAGPLILSRRDYTDDSDLAPRYVKPIRMAELARLIRKIVKDTFSQ